jgi:hypothetical protein
VHFDPFLSGIQDGHTNDLRRASEEHEKGSCVMMQRSPHGCQSKLCGRKTSCELASAEHCRPSIRDTLHCHQLLFGLSLRHFVVGKHLGISVGSDVTPNAEAANGCAFSIRKCVVAEENDLITARIRRSTEVAWNDK